MKRTVPAVANDHGNGYDADEPEVGPTESARAGTGGAGTREEREELEPGHANWTGHLDM